MNFSYEIDRKDRKGYDCLKADCLSNLEIVCFDPLFSHIYMLCSRHRVLGRGSSAERKGVRSLL